MGHDLLIHDDGYGEGGKATTETRWTPNHDLTPNEQMRRVGKVEKLQQKIHEILYAPPGAPQIEDE